MTRPGGIFVIHRKFEPEPVAFEFKRPGSDSARGDTTPILGQSKALVDWEENEHVSWTCYWSTEVNASEDGKATSDAQSNPAERVPAEANSQ